MTPKEKKGFLSLRTIPGMRVWKGRLRGEMTFGCAGSRTNRAPRLFSRIMTQSAQVIAFKDVQHLEHGDSLRLGAELVDVEPTIRRPDGIDPLRVEVREVTGSEHSIVLLRKLDDFLCNITLVKDIAA